MARTFLTLLVFCALGGSAQAQLPIGAGIKVGTTFNDAYNIANSALSGTSITTAYSANSNNFVIGPMVELRLPFSIAVEADALYRSVGFRRNGLTGGLATLNVDASAW